LFNIIQKDNLKKKIDETVNTFIIIIINSKNLLSILKQELN
jgi:hypothetical protein